MKPLATCYECGNEIYKWNEYYEDKDNFKYCSLECAIKANGIEEKEWEEE